MKCGPRRARNAVVMGRIADSLWIPPRECGPRGELGATAEVEGQGGGNQEVRVD
jgi:hypothetical protein